ncbi:MAG: tRNA pseudouridine(38-40) synthase TruA [Trueperaceae bacterium]
MTPAAGDGDPNERPSVDATLATDAPTGASERPSRRVALTIEFDGTAFRGWQGQPSGQRTVQGAFAAAFASLPGRHGPVHAAGRTDAGVHALAMVAHVDTESRIPDEKLRRALDAHLPRDVAVNAVQTVDAGFEAQFGCRYRRYVYRLRPVRDVPRGRALDRKRVLMIDQLLDVPAMRAAAGRFEGQRDFSSLATQETRSRVRTVHLCDLREERGELRLHVAGDGFLRGMVRAIVGTLLRVGRGTVAPEAIDALLDARDRSRAGSAVPPHGLYFAEAGYEPWDRARSEAALAALLDAVG